MLVSVRKKRKSIVRNRFKIINCTNQLVFFNQLIRTINCCEKLIANKFLQLLLPMIALTCLMSEREISSILEFLDYCLGVRYLQAA